MKRDKLIKCFERMLLLCVFFVLMLSFDSFAQESPLRWEDGSSYTINLGNEKEADIKYFYPKDSIDADNYVTMDVEDESVAIISRKWTSRNAEHSRMVNIYPLKTGKTKVTLTYSRNGVEYKSTIQIIIVHEKLAVKVNCKPIFYEDKVNGMHSFSRTVKFNNGLEKYDVEVKSTNSSVVIGWLSYTDVNTFTLKIDTKGKGKANIIIYNKKTGETLAKIPVKVNVLKYYSYLSLNINHLREGELFVNQTAKIDTYCSPKNAYSDKIKWKSSNNSVVTVSQKGVIKAIKPGTVIITAKAKEVSAKIKIKVKETKVKLAIRSQTRKVVLDDYGQVFSNKVVLEYTKFNDAPCSKIQIYRSDKKNGKYKLIATKKYSTKGEYVDKNVKPGKVYYYKIKGYSKLLKKYGPMSKTSMYGTSPKFSPKPQIGSSSVSWNKVKGATGYAVLQSYGYSAYKYWYIKEGFFVNCVTKETFTNKLSCPKATAPNLSGYYNVNQGSLRFCACVVAYAKIGNYYYVDGYPPLKSLSKLQKVKIDTGFFEVYDSFSYIKY